MVKQNYKVITFNSIRYNLTKCDQEREKCNSMVVIIKTATSVSCINSCLINLGVFTFNSERREFQPESFYLLLQKQVYNRHTFNN